MLDQAEAGAMRTVKSHSWRLRRAQASRQRRTWSVWGGMTQHRVVPTMAPEAANTKGRQNRRAAVDTAANDRERGTVMHCTSTSYNTALPGREISIRSVRRRRGESHVQKDLAYATDGGHG